MKVGDLVQVNVKVRPMLIPDFPETYELDGHYNHGIMAKGAVGRIAGIHKGFSDYRYFVVRSKRRTFYYREEHLRVYP